MGFLLSLLFRKPLLPLLLSVFFTLLGLSPLLLGPLGGTLCSFFFAFAFSFPDFHTGLSAVAASALLPLTALALLVRAKRDV